MTIIDDDDDDQWKTMKSKKNHDRTFVVEKCMCVYVANRQSSDR